MHMQSTEKKQCVSLVPIFANLDENELTKLSQKVTSRKVSKGEFLYNFTDQNDTLYIVHQGQLKNYQILENGEEQLIRLLGPGEFIGVWSIFRTKQSHDDLVEAISNTEICQLTQQDFKKVLIQYPEISINLLQQLSERLEVSEQQVATIAHTSVSDRIISYLTSLIPEETMENKPISIELPMSRKSLASYLDTTPESISRGCKKLERQGMITSTSSKKIRINKLSSV